MQTIINSAVNNYLRRCAVYCIVKIIKKQGYALKIIQQDLDRETELWISNACFPGSKIRQDSIYGCSHFEVLPHQWVALDSAILQSLLSRMLTSISPFFFISLLRWCPCILISVFLWVSHLLPPCPALFLSYGYHLCVLSRPQVDLAFQRICVNRRNWKTQAYTGRLVVDYAALSNNLRVSDQLGALGRQRFHVHVTGDWMQE